MSHIAESYLDNAATTPTRSEVIERMNEVMRDAWGNPSSVHAVGMRAKEVLEESRATIAGALGVEPGEVYFTSGGYRIEQPCRPRRVLGATRQPCQDHHLDA